MKNERTPFAVKLKSPYHDYFYDVNRNSIVQISSDAAFVLEKWLANKVTRTEAIDSNSQISLLVDNGYLSDKRPEKIEHGMTPFLKDALSRRISQMTLQVTQNCNFRCRYCAYSNFETDKQRSHTNVSMSYETACKAVDFFFERSMDAESPLIGFYGGEPLLMFPLMKEVVAYAKQRFAGRKLRFNITTNASLMNEEVVKFFIENAFSVTVSIDGPREIHDLNRKMADMKTGTFDIVIQRLEEAVAKYPAFRDLLMINMVVDPKNDVDCANDLFVSYDVLDRETINATLVDTTYLSEDFNATQEFRIKSEYDYFVALLSKYREIDNQFISPLNIVRVRRLESDIDRMSSIEFLPDTTAPGGPCLPGVLRLFVDVNGRLFPCERCSENSAIMNIGTIENGFDYDKCNTLLNVAQFAADECRECWALNRCSVCAAQIEDGDHYSIDKKHSRCRDIHSQALSFLYDKIALNEIGDIERNRKRGV